MQDKRKFKILQKLFLFSCQILFDGNDTQFQKSLFFFLNLLDMLDGTKQCCQVLLDMKSREWEL